LKINIQKKIIRTIFSHFFKKKNISIILYLSSKPFFKKEGYWVLQQLLNRGYLNHSNSLMHMLPYKKHFECIIRRINSMMMIKSHGFSINKLKKIPIKVPNVLFCVHNSMPYDFAGYAIRTKNISQELINHDTNVTIATRPGYPLDLLKHRGFHNNIPDEDFIHNVKYIRLLDNDKKFKRGADVEYLDIYAKALVEYSKKNNINILHAHSNYLNGHAAIKASNILKIPVIYELRGLWHKTRTLLDKNYEIGGMFEYEEIMEKYALLNVDVAVTISKELKKLIVSWGVEEKKIYVIPNSVDTTKFSPLAPVQHLIEKYQLKDKIVIGFIGSLTNYEGLQELVNAVDELIEENLNIALLIVGGGREKEKLQKLAKSKHIIFTGHVPFDSVLEYYSIIDICPFPRNNVEICNYVPPLKILEAMSMKKAVIVSDVAPLLHIMNNGKNGLICRADDIDSLKEMITLYYTDAALREKFTKTARAWVENNRSIDTIGLKYKKLYDSFR